MIENGEKVMGQGNGNNFMLHQYKALRAEIDYKNKMLIRFQGISVSAIPIVIGAGFKYELDFVVLSAPIITVVFALVLLFIQTSIMRAGEFLRTIVEPALLKHNETGWESWLEEIEKNRMAERFFAWSAYVAFSLYYIGGTYLAKDMLEKYFGDYGAIFGLGLYGGIFIVTLFLIGKYLKISTKELALIWVNRGVVSQCAGRSARGRATLGVSSRYSHFSSETLETGTLGSGHPVGSVLAFHTFRQLHRGSVGT